MWHSSAVKKEERKGGNVLVLGENWKMRETGRKRNWERQKTGTEREMETAKSVFKDLAQEKAKNMEKVNKGRNKFKSQIYFAFGLCLVCTHKKETICLHTHKLLLTYWPFDSVEKEWEREEGRVGVLWISKQGNKQTLGSYIQFVLLECVRSALKWIE